MDKDHLLKESKVFCMFPWVHMNATPKGDIYPCCSNAYSDAGFGNTRKITLEEAFNSNKMKELRLNMLNDKPSEICKFCYKHEEAGPYSFRNYSKDHFAKYFDEVVMTTLPDGTVPEFKMRYFDIRFSNICNFKCRTCGAEFSSQWAAENRQRDKKHPIIMHADNHRGDLLDEVLTHIDHIDLAYFAGGEPLITDEHYVMLEEMIRRGRTDITLRYNTNASNIKYKQHDILDLWKHFKRVELSCSVDHYGERAEWLRKGTDWGVVESNLLKFRELDYIDFQINTVFSIFNYLTLGDFYSYLIKKNIVRKDDWYHSLYLAVHPDHYSAKSMPKELKDLARQKAFNFTNVGAKEYPCIQRLVNEAVNFADSEDNWETNKPAFFDRALYIDKIRNENVFNVFPELSKLPILNK
jgi:radical SAM protein with 4Fe4S-binding SPASM domain